jgi:S1-C subfamily serine protease
MLDTQGIINEIDTAMSDALRESTRNKELSIQAVGNAIRKMEDNLRNVLSSCDASDVDMRVVTDHVAKIVRDVQLKQAKSMPGMVAPAAMERLRIALARAKRLTDVPALHAPTTGPHLAGGAAECSTTENNMRAIVRIQAYFQDFSIKSPYVPGAMHQSTGTGFVIGRRALADGDVELRVMTAAHVVHGSRRRSIRIPRFGMKQFNAEVVVFIPSYDIATITAKVPSDVAQRFVGQLSLASDDEIASLDRGAQVQAYGFPNGLEQPKASQGIFNGLERHELMHDASTSPGSSGGPLVAMDFNKVIGIVSWKVVARAVEGVQFTMPVSLWHSARSAAGRAMASGEPVVVPPVFGFCVQETDSLTFKVAAGTLPYSGGARVCRVVSGTPADKAGMEVGDVIVKFDGMAIDRFSQTADAPWSPLQKVSLREIMFRIADQAKHSITVLRRGEERTFHMVPVDRAKTMQPMYEPWTRPRWLVLDGIVMIDSYDQLAKVHDGLRKMDSSQFFKETHVAVTNVVRGTPAADVKVIKWGDIVTHVGGEPVSTVRDVKHIVESTTDLDAPIEIRTKHNKTYTTTRRRTADTAKFMLDNGAKSLTNLAPPSDFLTEVSPGDAKAPTVKRVRFAV